MRSRTIKKTVFVLFVTCALTGCAGVSFYEEASLETRTGIPIYAPKPFLLVARTGAMDKPVDVSVVYLTDTRNPIFAKPRSGLGSANLTLTLANGQMTSFGQQTDTKIPELITALGDFLTSRATAEQTEEGEKILAEGRAFELYEILYGADGAPALRLVKQ